MITFLRKKEIEYYIIEGIPTRKELKIAFALVPQMLSRIFFFNHSSTVRSVVFVRR